MSSLHAVRKVALGVAAAAFLALPLVAAAQDAPNACGDGTLDADEQCDDGNHASGDGCRADCLVEGPLDPTERSCVNALTKGFAKALIKANKASLACARGVAGGTMDLEFEDCLYGLDYEIPSDELALVEEERCWSTGVTTETAFGYGGDAYTSFDAGANAAFESFLSVLGSPAALARRGAAAGAATCQQAVVGGVSRYLDALVRETAKRKKASLRDPVAPALTSLDLEADLLAAPKATKLAVRLAALAAKADKKCAGEPLGALFGQGACQAKTGSASALVECGTQVAACELCKGVNEADGLALSCNRFSGWADCDPDLAECADGLVSEDEECDDGNAIDGDGCDAECYLEECEGDDETCVPSEEPVEPELECELAGGETVDGACWFLGAAGASCAETCDDAGLAYDDATETVAGSGGTNASCTSVLNALGLSVGNASARSCDTGIGCYGRQLLSPLPLASGGRCTGAETDAASAPPAAARRACACTGARPPQSRDFLAVGRVSSRPMRLPQGAVSTRR